MPEQRRGEVRIIVEHFLDKPVTNAAIQEFCNLQKIEPITLGELQDYTVQVKHDNVVGELFPKILAELQKLKFQPEFASEKERKAIEQGNDEVRVSIAKLFEDHAIEYKYVSALSEELGRQVGTKIEMAGTTVFNKALEVMLHITREKFGGEFNMKHAADYAEEVFAKAKPEDKKEEA